MAEKDLFTRDLPPGATPPRKAAAGVLESPRMSLAPVPTPASVPGAVPPQNLEAEESVLGAMMISPGAIAAVSEILDAGDFYRESHAKIYRAALQLYGKNEPVDAITLTNELERCPPGFGQLLPGVHPAIVERRSHAVHGLWICAGSSR